MLGLSLCIILGLSIPERSKDSVSRIAHFECFNIVRLVEHEIRKVEGPFRRHFPPAGVHQDNSASSNTTTGQTAQTETKTANLNEIVQQLSKNCDRLIETRAEVCKDVLKEENVKRIYDYIKEGKRPDFICSSIGYKRVVPSASRIINKDVCSQVITLIKNDFNRSVTPLFGRHRFGFHGSNSSIGSITKNPDTTTTKNATLLEEPRTNSSSVQTPGKSSNSSLTHGMFSQMNKFTSFFTRKGPRVCRQFVDTPNYQQCLILSRIAIRAARPQIKAGNSSESICEFLESAKLIQLTDKDVGAIAEERDREQIQRNFRRGRPDRDMDEARSYKRRNRPDDENAPLRRSDRNLDRDFSSRHHDKDSQTRPKIENNN